MMIKSHEKALAAGLATSAMLGLVACGGVNRAPSEPEEYPPISPVGKLLAGTAHTTGQLMIQEYYATAGLTPIEPAGRNAAEIISDRTQFPDKLEIHTFMPFKGADLEPNKTTEVLFKWTHFGRKFLTITNIEINKDPNTGSWQINGARNKESQSFTDMYGQASELKLSKEAQIKRLIGVLTKLRGRLFSELT